MRVEPIPSGAFCYLYLSIMKYCSHLTDKNEVKYILFHSYLANHATCKKAGLKIESPIDSECFMSQLNQRTRPYRTPVQLCKSIRYLLAQMNERDCCAATRRAVNNLCYWIYALNEDFVETHGSRLNDNQSVYRLCHWGLVPPMDEPMCCLLADMPDAYARLRDRYLSEYRPDEYEKLRMSRRLYPHLAHVNRHALDTHDILEHCLLDTPSACGRSPEAAYHRYLLREKVEEMVLKNVVFNDRLWEESYPK